MGLDNILMGRYYYGAREKFGEDSVRRELHNMINEGLFCLASRAARALNYWDIVERAEYELHKLKNKHTTEIVHTEN